MVINLIKLNWGLVLRSCCSNLTHCIMNVRLTMANVLEIRANAFADDIEVTDAMCEWSEAKLTEYFENGGEIRELSDVASMSISVV